MELKLFATCPNEITHLLAEEIKGIGGKDVEISYRCVYFTATQQLYYKSHLHLRLASRVFRIIKEIPAGSPTIIFDKAKRIKFHEYFSSSLPVKINVIVGSQDDKIEGHLVGSKIREAITDSFKHNCGEEANLSARDAIININAFYKNNRVMISIDTALKSMHKRGYRVEGHPAPMKETLASCLLKLVGYDGSQVFYDPMCGSGTIVNEAAQIACHKAPLIHRKKNEFGFEYLKDFDNQVWKKVQDEARQQQIEPPTKIFAGDISSEYLEIARQSALGARVEKYIDFKVGDFFKSEKPAETGIMVTNFPYGLRLDEQEISQEFVSQIGDHLKTQYKGWTCGILLPQNCPYKHVGLKPESRTTLKNGSVDVKFLIFKIY